MSTTLCGSCGHEIEFGEFPFCPHGEIYERNAQSFTPILIDQSLSDPNQFSFPGSNNIQYDPVPSGYRRIEIRNMREADHWVGRINDVERGKAEFNREMNKQYFNERAKERRDSIRAKIRGNSRAEALFRAACAYTDKKAEKRFSGALDPRFHIQVLSFDSGNRASHSSSETGWRERKS